MMNAIDDGGHGGRSKGSPPVQQAERRGGGISRRVRFLILVSTAVFCVGMVALLVI
jgi:hypothetical protein